MLYLWRAHNIVNKRLHGQSTEDKLFPKYQFPPKFLCENCKKTENYFNQNEIKNFLINYYGNVKP